MTSLLISHVMDTLTGFLCTKINNRSPVHTVSKVITKTQQISNEGTKICHVISNFKPAAPTQVNKFFVLHVLLAKLKKLSFNLRLPSNCVKVIELLFLWIYCYSFCPRLCEYSILFKKYN